jgi:probable HAF family extracellular repeat protein
MKSLGSLGGNNSDGLGINNAGQVVGTADTSSGGGQHAFRYDGPAGSGIMRDLGVLTGFTDSAAYGINSSGQVVGALSSADASHAFIYKGTPGIDGVMTDLNTLPGGTLSEADAINDAGFVVGFSDESADSNLQFHPVLWRPDGSMADIEAWLDAANPSLGDNWDLKDSFITGINSAGQIVGDGIYLGSGPLNGHQVGYILDASGLLPEPSAAAFLLGGFGLVFRRTRKQSSPAAIS